MLAGSFADAATVVVVAVTEVAIGAVICAADGVDGVAVPVTLIDEFEPENSDWSEAVGVINCVRLVRFLNWMFR